MHLKHDRTSDVRANLPPGLVQSWYEGQKRALVHAQDQFGGSEKASADHGGGSTSDAECRVQRHAQPTQEKLVVQKARESCNGRVSRSVVRFYSAVSRALIRSDRTYHLAGGPGANGNTFTM